MGNRDGKGRAILMCAGEYEPMEILRGAEDFVVAVDGGLARLLEAGIEPDLVLGDFDSLEEKYLPWLDCLKNTRPERLSQLPCEKDDTDTLHAVRVCLERGYKRIDLYGALGGRLDHTIANIQTLSWIRRQGGCGYLLGKNTLATVLCGEMILLPDTFEGTFSIFALDGRVTGVTLEGMKYPLFEWELTNTFPLGVSNEVSNKVSNEVSNEAGTEKRASASVREGLALMILNRREGAKGIDPGELERREIR